MTRRERVRSAILFENPRPVPYAVDFTEQMLQKMIAHTGNACFLDTLDNAIASAYLIKPEEEVRPEFFRDEFGVVWNKSGVDKDIGVVDAYCIEDPAQLDAYAFPPVDEAYIRGRMENLMRKKGDRFAIAAIGFSLFERAWTLHGMENLLCNMVADPEFVHALMGRIAERNLRILDIALEYDIDCFHFGDDWGQQKGLIMGPTHWREFIKPYLARMYGRVRQAGKFVSQHSCGDIRPVMEDLFEIGLNMYQTYQPEIYGLDYARKLEGKVTVWGGISTQRALPVKTPAEIEQITVELLRAFPSGGLVAAPTHAVPGDVPPENILAMLRVLDHQDAFCE
ncbi:MAG TPA: uroporphyrinogen decarboxylase family protein, partial [Clostridia bacterium]|nr:uroporphyrinogen decarboxylase family protein [Clostridia bacterium]